VVAAPEDMEKGLTAVNHAKETFTLDSFSCLKEKVKKIKEYLQERPNMRFTLFFSEL
jgi:hypothetical protein